MSEPLTWKNDPIFFDSEPLPVNQWLNANELIEKGQAKQIFLSDTEMLNLYPIMVRKSDFVRVKTSDRIMARFPFVVLGKSEQELIRAKILLLSEFVRNYFYQSINKSILQWKDTILKYLEKGSLPYPIVRCCFELMPTFPPCNDSVSHFTSARGEKFKMPTTLTNELAYLAGMVNGDGNLQKYTLRIVDYSIKNIKQLQTMFQVYFDQTGNILYKTPNSPEVVITNLWVVRFFSFLTSQPIGTKKYDSLREPLIFKQEPFRSYYWSGVMDADGSYKNKVEFVSASLRYAQDFKKFLISNKIDSTLTEKEDSTVSVYIPSRFHNRLEKLLYCLHPEKKLEFDNLLSLNSRTATFFVGFKDDSLINGYFNFRLLHNMSVNGLSKSIRALRGKQARRIFVENLDISERALQSIEKGTMSINILLLERILHHHNLQLMPFLTQQESIQYHIRSSELVSLDSQPNEKLASLLEPLTFYKNSINIPEENLVQELENHFQIKISANKITNKLLLRFFTNFCNLKLLKNTK
ncbi:MAG: hypothetical protein HZR80_12510 [Candidatus Heimdallarchaeota archaeon]